MVAVCLVTVMLLSPSSVLQALEAGTKMPCTCQTGILAFNDRLRVTAKHWPGERSGQGVFYNCIGFPKVLQYGNELRMAKYSSELENVGLDSWCCLCRIWCVKHKIKAVASVPGSACSWSQLPPKVFHCIRRIAELIGPLESWWLYT